MSDTYTGADLEQLDALATAYETRGAEIAARGHDLNRRILDAVTVFRAALATLRTQAATANTSLLEDVQGLVDTAAATTWTGANRARFDEDLGTLRAGITTTTDAVLGRLDELEQRGVEPFNGMLEEFGVQTSASGDVAAQTGQDMRTTVGNQRTALLDAAGCWTAV
ncbi:MAG: hypothetical protein ACK5OX_11355 [Desertimonas sp.]